MNGDLTRARFDATLNYTAVRAQQGRVMLDADHNEQVDIQLSDTRAGRVDVIGGSGAPADEPGFGISVVGNQPTLGAGRYLVDGIRVSNPAARTLASGQPFLEGNTLPTTDGAWLAYLEVWERPVSAVEAPAIREVALGGPDTTLRDQLVWQIRWRRLGEVGVGDCTSADASLQALEALFDGTLEPRLETSSVSNPCVVSEAAAFRGLENQLYRIEIHAGNLGPDGASTGLSPTFKWSRDNASVIGAAISLLTTSPLVLQVDRLGPGGAAGFEIGRSVEIQNRAGILQGQPGILARVDDVRSDGLELTLLGGATTSALQAMLTTSGVVVKAWQSVDPVAASTTFAKLEDGLEVRFPPGGDYRTGDFWLIPARTSKLPGTDQPLEWPVVAPMSSTFVARKSFGPVRHRAALAIVDRTGTTWTLRSDCRRLFPPLVSVWTLESTGGDGQHGPGGDWLPSPIRVVLSRGSRPIPDARLRFRVTSGGGQISATDPTAPTPVTEGTVTTDANGRAQIFWRLGPSLPLSDMNDNWEPELAQSVEVVRLTPANTPVGPAVSFVAQAIDPWQLHIVGGNGQQGRPGETLEVALRVRVDNGERPVQNAVVEFEVLNRIFNGQSLNQDTGGSVHASSGFVSGSVWPGGVRFHTVRARTDSNGIAQVQWMLGTRLELPTQRIEARLLDRGSNPTKQTGLFVAQLALASEVRWEPLVPWLSGAVGTDPRVQKAIDELALQVAALLPSSNQFAPFLGLRWRSTAAGGPLAALGPNDEVQLAALAALVFRDDLIAADRDPALITAHSGVRVYADVVAGSIFGSNFGLPQASSIQGNFHRSAGRWEWTLSSESRSMLMQAMQFGGEQSVPMRVQVVPRWLPGGIASDSTVVHEAMFRVRR